MICPISNENRDNLKSFVIDKLEDLLDQKAPLSVKGLMASVYTEFGKDVPSDQALSFVQQVPSILREFMRSDDLYQENFASNLQEIISLQKQLDTDTPLKSVADYLRESLGIQAKVVIKVNQQVSSKAGFTTVPQDNQFEDPQASTLKIKQDIAFNAMPSNPNSTTGSEVDSRGVPYPERVQRYRFIRTILEKFSKGEVVESTELSLVPGGIRLSAMSAYKLGAYKPAGINEKDVIMVITDENGNILRFNENNELSEEGSPMFYGLRTITSTKKKDGKTTITYDPPIMDPQSVVNKRNIKGDAITLNEYKNVLKKDSEFLIKLKEYIRSNPDAVVMTIIDGGSNGYIPYDESTVTMLEDINFSDDPLVIQTQKSKTGPFYEGASYFQVRGVSNPILISRKPMSREIIEKIASTLIDTLKDRNTSNQVYELSNLQKLDLVLQYRANTSMFSVGINEATNNIVVNMRGKSVEITADNKETIRKQIIDFFTIPQPIEWSVEDVPNALNGDLPSFTPVGLKQGTIVRFGTGAEKKYFKYITPEFTINESLLRDPQTFNNYSLEPAGDGSFMLINRMGDSNGGMNYIRFVKANSFVKYSKSPGDNKLRQANAYFTFRVPEAEKQKVIPLTQDFAETPFITVYQGYNENVDEREFNYFTINKEEAQNYGTNIREVEIDTTGALDTVSNRDLYSDLKSEFKALTGKNFDILLNDAEGLKTQNEFFNFLRNKGYTGLNMLKQGDSQYFVSFTKEPVKPKTKSAADKFIEDIENGLYKTIIVKTGEVVATPEQIAQAKVWFDKSPLSQHIGFQELFNAVNSEAVAEFFDGAIVLYAGSNYSDLYHESWHGFSQMFMTIEQKVALYKELGKKSGSFVTNQGKRITFKEASYQELEEYLAEDFREYMLSDGKTYKGKVRNSIFRKILDFLKALFGDTTYQQMLINDQATDTVQELYEKLRVGNLTGYTFSASNQMFGKLNKGVEAVNIADPIQSLSPADSIEARKTIDSIFSSFQDELNARTGKQYTSHIFRTVKGRMTAYSRALERLIEKRQEILQELGKTPVGLQEQNGTILNAYIESRYSIGSNISYVDTKGESATGEVTGYLKDKETGKINQIRVNNINVPISEITDTRLNIGQKRLEEGEINLTKRNLDTLNWMINNYGDPTDIKTYAEGAKGLIAYHNKKSEFLAYEDRGMEDAADNNVPQGFKLAGNETSVHDAAKPEVLYMLRGLQKMKRTIVNGEVVYEPVYNRLGFPELVELSPVVNRLAKILHNSKDPEEMYSRLVNEVRQSGNRFYYLNQLLSKLGNPSNNDPMAQDMWGSFWKTFNLYFINQPIVFMDNVNGEWKTRTGTSYGDKGSMKRAWDIKFSMADTESPFVRRTVKSKAAILNLDELLTRYPTQVSIDSDKAMFIRDLGIPIDLTDIDMRKELYDNPQFKDFGRYMLDRMKLLKKNLVVVTDIKTFFSRPIIVGDKELAENRLYNSIVELFVKYSDTYSDASLSTPEGDTRYALSLNSSATAVAKALNGARSFSQDVLSNHLSYLDFSRNPWAKRSWSLYSMFDPETGYMRRMVGNTPISNYVIENVSGLTILENGESVDLGINSSSADETAMLMMNIAYFLQQGVIPNPTPGEKSTRLSTRVSRYMYNDKTGKLSQSGKIWMDVEHFSQVNASSLSTKIYHSILPYLLAETDRIAIMKRADSSPEMIENNFEVYKKNGKNFLLFDQIISDNTKNRIISLLEEGFNLESYLESNSEEAFDLKSTISQEFMAYWENEFQKNITLYQKGNRITNDILGELIKKFPTLKKYANFRENRASRTELETSVLKALTFNTFIHNTEATIINYGDPAQYATEIEFHKRIQMFSSTGEIFRTDAMMMNTINQMLTSGYSKSIGINFKGCLEGGYFSNILNTAIMDDPKMTSIYIKQIAESLRKDITRSRVKYNTDNFNKKSAKAQKEIIDAEVEKQTKAYMKMKVADAQGWITFDSYRVLSRAMNDWSPAQEDLFQRIVRGENVDLGMTIKYFPVLKYQYAGALATNSGLPVMAGHKFSLMPLIPNVIQGSPNLMALHEKMMRSNVDYATMKSGSKITTITHAGVMDNFYKNNDLTQREFDDERNDDGSYKNPFMPNKVYMEFLKKQQPTNTEYKESSIFATQLRKIIEEGLVEGGVPTDFMPDEINLDKKIKAWEKLSEDKKVKYPKYVLYTAYEKAISELTDKKKQKLLKDIGWDTDEKYGKVNSSLLEFLKKEMSRQDISDHEVSYLDIMYNGALKYNDLSLHLSQELIEKVILSIVNRNLIRQKINGEPLIQVSGIGWENMADWKPKYSLTNPTEEQLEKFGTNGLTYYQYGKGPNGSTLAMTVKIALQGDYKKLLNLTHKDGNKVETLDRLNETIKDEEWLNKGNNRSLITMVGVRIPVQGLNSMEFMQVAEFLPENAGNMIILPAEIVAKSGSDFDIDKLSVYMPNIQIKKGKVETDAVKAVIPQNKVSGVASYGSTVTANDAAIKALGEKTTSIDMIEAGFRTRTTRSANEMAKYNIQVGDIIANKGKSANGKEKTIYARVTAIHLKGSPKWLSTWEKEGWRAEDVKAISSFKDGAAAIEFELLSPDVSLEDGDTEKGAENRLIQSMIDILKFPDNYASLVRPNDTYTLDPIVNDEDTGIRDFVSDYNPKVGPDGTKLSKISGSDLMQYRYNLYVHVVNKVAQEALGIAAVDNTFNILFNRVGAYMNSSYRDGTKEQLRTPKGGIIKDITLFMQHNTLTNEKGQKVISLSHIMDALGEHKISDNISQIINLLLEIAKNDSAYYLQLNKEIIPTLLFLNQAGVPIKQLVYFAAHPIIRDYMNEIRKARTPVSDVIGTTAQGDRNFFVSTARTRIMEKYNMVADSEKEMELDPYTIYLGPYRNAKGKHAHKNMYQAMMKLARNNDGTLTDTAQKAFDQNNLLADIKEYDQKTQKTVLSPEEQLILLHWFHIEDFSKPIRDIKLRLNFDTSRTKSAFMSANKKAMIEALAVDERIPYSVVTQLLENSPISSLYLVEKGGNPFVMDLLTPLLPLRANPKITAFLNSKLSSYAEVEEINDTFGNPDRFVNKFMNDLVGYIFQENLRSFNITSIKGYRNMVVQGGVPVEKIPYLKFGAFVKDGVMYIDTKQLIKDFQEGNYLIPGTSSTITGDNYQNRGLAPLGNKVVYKSGDYKVDEIFTTTGEYFNFVLEREYIRSYVTVNDLVTDSHFNGLRIINVKQTDKLAEETSESYNLRIDRITYEQWIRDRALDNIGNGWKLFYSEDSYAKQVDDAFKKYGLREKEPLLDNIVVNEKEVKSPYDNKTIGVIRNLNLLDYDLTGEKVDAYHKIISDLSNPAILKSDALGNPLSPQENQRLSELFSRMPVVAFLQSGLTTTGPFSLTRLVPAGKVMDYLSGAVADYVNKIDITGLEAFYSKFKTLNGNYTLSKRYKDYTKGSIPILASRTKMTAVYGSTQVEGAVTIYGVSPFYGLYDTSKLNISSANKTAKAFPNRVFVYELATIETNPPVGSSGYFSPEKSKADNVVGIPTRLRFSNKETDSLTDETLNENMLAIEKAIQQLKIQAKTKKLTFSDTGYGQNLIGLKEDGITPVSKERPMPAPMTFMYLSQRLFQEFGYVNPNYQGQRLVDTVTPIEREVSNITDVDLTTYLSEKKKNLGKWKKDAEVMNNSQAAIGYPLTPQDSYESSSVAYAKALNEKGIKTGIQYFTDIKSVWIFGNLAGYGKITETILKPHFEGLYKPRIDEAIAAGVQIFNIGDAKSGIDVMAAEYLKTIGFRPIKHTGWTSWTREPEKPIGELTFSLEMISKIKSGEKTSMSGNVDLIPGLYKLTDGSIIRVGTPIIYKSIRDVTKAYGTAEKWAKSEGFSSFNNLKTNTQSEFLKSFIQGATSNMRTYPIAPQLNPREKAIEQANKTIDPEQSIYLEDDSYDFYDTYNNYQELLTAYENGEIPPSLVEAAYQELRSVNLLKYLNYNPNQLSLTFPSQSVINGEILDPSEVLASKSVVTDNYVMDQIIRCITG